jgi:hypothetical protein
VPIRFFAALHDIVLSGDDPELAEAYAGERELWPAVRGALERHRSRIARFVAEQPVQTNEVLRCWTLLPAFLLAASRAEGRRLDLIELGPSGGLNLLWDRYHYVYGDRDWGEPGSAVELCGELRRPFPLELLDTDVVVGRRVGIDRHPVDATSEAGRQLLSSFVWADHPERLERLRLAVELARARPPKLVRGDYVELLPDVLTRRDVDALTIVFSSASTQYLSDEEYSRVRDALRADAARGNLAWVAAEPPRERPLSDTELRLRQWPRSEELLARVHYHGRWLDWQQ